jgi:hemerythrin
MWQKYRRLALGRSLPQSPGTGRAMRWDQNFESGLSEIDAQHRAIFALVQRVEGLEDHTDRSDIRAVIVDLERYARCHFECEEYLMAAYDYPATARHIAEHENLLREVEHYRDSLAFRPRQLALVLGNWLISHTMLEDRPLALHVQRLRASDVEVSPGAVGTFLEIAARHQVEWVECA